jgi:hypothetical protein
MALSSADSAVFQFHDAPVEIDAPVTRAQYEEWIAEEMAQGRSRSREERADRLVVVRLARDAFEELGEKEKLAVSEDEAAAWGS